MSRHLEPLSDEDQETILGFVDAARAAATGAALDEPESPHRAAEERYPGPRTGHKLARLTGAAGATAAHAIRLRAISELASDASPWTSALAHLTAPLSSWDWDERMQAALDLRKTFKDEPPPPPASVRPVRLVAAWLTHAGGAGLIPATRQLCEYVMANPDRDALHGAWYAVHGLALLDDITAGGEGTTMGRPTATQADYRARLRAVVEGLHAAQIMSDRALAARAGITRPTLTSWTDNRQNERPRTPGEEPS